MYSKNKTTNDRTGSAPAGTLTKQIRHDLTVGLLHAWPKFLPVLLIFLIPAFQMGGMIRSAAAMGHLSGVFTWGDMALYAFRGMNVYIPSPGTSFEIPVVWLLINLYLAYIIGNYPIKDIHGYGQQILLRSRKRGQWWVGKCVWNILSVVVYYGLGWLTLAAATLLTGGRLSLQVTPELLGPILQIQQAPTARLILSAALLPVAYSVSLSCLQMMVMMMLKPIGGYVAATCVTAASAYFYTPFLIGNGSMLLRSDLVMENGISLTVSLVSCLAVGLFSLLTGYFYFRRSDILDKS